MVLLLLLVLGAIIALEAPGLVRQRMWREIAVFSFLLAVGTIYSAAELFDISLPNPTTITETLYQPVSGAIEKLLKMK